MNAYEAKQAARRERLENAADRHTARGRASLDAARRLSSAIPFGQPVLVGHHSERRHRRDLERIDGGRRRGFAELDRAAELRGRAAAVGTGGISQDDPDAVAKLAAELAALQAARAAEVAANAALKRAAKARLKGREKGATLTQAEHLEIIAGLGLADGLARKLESYARAFPWLPQFGPHTGANIRRIEKRIAELRAKASTPARETIETDRYTISECPDENRTRITFAERQPSTIVDALKSYGFRWAPSVGAWQRMRSNGAWWAATQIAAMVDRAAAEVMP